MGCKRSMVDLDRTPPTRGDAKRVRTLGIMSPSPEYGSKPSLSFDRPHGRSMRLDGFTSCLDTPPFKMATTPRRPPRPPRFDRPSNVLGSAGGPSSSGPSERVFVSQLYRLSAAELLNLVKDVEIRFHQLAAFEAEEIRRAQRLGFALGRTTSAPQTAW